MPESATSYRFSFGPWNLSEGADSFGPEVRRGCKAEDVEILRRTEQLIGQGTAGIVYGRRFIRYANPAGMTRAEMAIVHEGATAEEALLSPKGGKS
jgi:class I fructose-bisphosphate aldolase